MKCELCKGETIIKRGRRYHYAECGLENVYLENINLRVCEACGEISPCFPRINDLQAAIVAQRADAMALPVNQRKPGRYSNRPKSELAYA